MGYVNMRERRGERGQVVTGTPDSERAPEVVSSFLKVGGLLFGLSASVMLGSTILAAATLVAGVTILFRELWQTYSRAAPRGRTRLGSEKQLLLALRESGGLTAVEAALETSLTVDEAEGILSRLAERGHLRVESRDGVLSYALPGGHAAGVAGPLREAGGRTS